MEGEIAKRSGGLAGRMAVVPTAPDLHQWQGGSVAERTASLLPISDLPQTLQGARSRSAPSSRRRQRLDRACFDRRSLRQYVMQIARVLRPSEPTFVPLGSRRREGDRERPPLAHRPP